jgi:hypothetical protein
VIFAGTPEGVGAVARGQTMVALLAHRTVHRQRDGALVRVADLGGATQHADRAGEVPSTTSSATPSAST